MGFELIDIFPNASQGLSNIGFLFGAGCSLKAGYPLMPELTIKAIEKLSKTEFDLLDMLVNRMSGRNIDKTIGTPNIEEVSDILEAALITVDRGDNNYLEMLQVRSSIRDKIVNVLLSTSTPDLENHIRFFNALNRILLGKPESVWIFTTNYDLLFEIAASIAKVPLVDGFFGTSLRYFNLQSLNYAFGSISGATFSHHSQPVVRLIKLHGSLNWWKHDNSIYSSDNLDFTNSNYERIMVLPRRKKITDTLETPFGELFRFAEKIIGSKCKYLVSCGYGYGDEHINDTLLLPKLQQGKIRLTAFIKSDTPYLDQFKVCMPFSFGSEDTLRKSGITKNVGTDLWQFDNLVNLFCRQCGL